MNTNELLVRTMNAAKEARDQGFTNTADSFDEITETLITFLNSQVITECETDARVKHLHS